MNDLLASLMNSDIEENQEFGSLLLKSKDIPEEDREVYIKQIIVKYLDNNNSISSTIMNNVIDAYSNLSSINTLKNRVKKL
jgi:hypothetical protein